MEKNLHPIFDRLLQRSIKEERIHQRGHSFWLTGLSGAGKSTIAQHFEKTLYENNYISVVLDGDNIRSGLNKDLGFSESDRYESLRRVAEVNKLFVQIGIICINSFISPLEMEREMVKKTIGEADFSEIHIAADLSTCEKRDVKGLYEKVRKQEIQHFIGIHTPYEIPPSPALRLDTQQFSIEECVHNLMEYAKGKIVR